jgi:hypothetical protein
LIQSALGAVKRRLCRRDLLPRDIDPPQMTVIPSPRLPSNPAREGTFLIWPPCRNIRPHSASGRSAVAAFHYLHHCCPNPKTSAFLYMEICICLIFPLSPSISANIRYLTQAPHLHIAAATSAPLPDRSLPSDSIYITIPKSRDSASPLPLAVHSTPVPLVRTDLISASQARSVLRANVSPHTSLPSY